MELIQKIKKTIAFGHFVSVGDLITEALYHPLLGYYKKNQVVGKDHDYITASHLGSFFAHGVARWIQTIRLDHCISDHQPWRIVELGPGRGQWIHDILCYLDHFFPDVVKNLHLVLVECNPLLKKHQEALIQSIHPKICLESITWFSSVEQIDQQSLMPTMIIANEFFDCLPVEQWYKNEKRQVLLDQNNHLFFQNFPSIYETCSSMKAIITHLKTIYPSGWGLFIDYGDDIDSPKRFGDTIQSIKNHQRVDMLSNLGACDITHQVDFYRLKQFFPYHRICWFRDFLYRYAVFTHLLPHDALSAYRLLSVGQMGHHFKVLEVSW
jgi:NADH dehydrogenase [ubiquinone] 1 alpha subcomplex assembly factor 7